MTEISFNLGCRNCLHGDPSSSRNLITIKGAESEEYKNKTDFELMSLIEYWMQEDNYTCNVCGSSNVEVMDIEVDNYPLYDSNNLIEKCKANSEYLIMFNIDKNESTIELQSGGSNYVDEKCFKYAIQEIIHTIYVRPSDQFIPQGIGNFFVCLTGINTFTVERFRSFGLERDEIINELRAFADQEGIEMPLMGGSSSKNNTF